MQAPCDAETGLLGYQASHDPALLTPYQGARERALGALSTLQDELVLWTGAEDEALDASLDALTEQNLALNAKVSGKLTELRKVNEDLRAAQHLLTHRTLHDPLTGLPNRTQRRGIGPCHRSVCRLPLET